MTESKRLLEEEKTMKASKDLTDDSKEPVENLDDWKIEHTRLCKVFKDWCFENGVRMPKLQYPAYFEGGLIGMMATEPVEHREAFISVPYKMLLTVDGAQRHPVLGPIIKNNPKFFHEEYKGDWEQLNLVIYIMYEFAKGEGSFWKPWLDMMPNVIFFCHWTKDQILATQDPSLIRYSTDYKEELKKEWDELETLLREHPDIFPESVLKAELFYKIYAQVCTRCFGWGLPSTSMMPMADNFNHSDVKTKKQVVNKKMHLEAERSSKYFTKTKYMNDYSICFDEEDYMGDPQATLNIKGRFNKANFLQNSQFTQLEKIKSAINNGV